MSKAIRIHQHGGPEVLRWEEVETGEPGPGQVRIRHGAVGLNYIDVYHRTGLYPLPSLPWILGMEGAGKIEAVGEGVTEFKLGDRVAYASPPVGAYAEVRLMAADRVVALPDAISDKTAAAMMLQGMTAQYLLRRTYRVQPGDAILFHAAAGGVGLMASQWARHLGATAASGRDRHRHGGQRRKSRIGPRARLPPCHRVQSRKFHRAGPRDHRRPRRGGGVRFRGQGHLHGFAGLFAADGHAGQLRQCLGAGAGVRAGHFGRQGLAVPHPADLARCSSPGRP